MERNLPKEYVKFTDEKDLIYDVFYLTIDERWHWRVILGHVDSVAGVRYYAEIDDDGKLIKPRVLNKS